MKGMLHNSCLEGGCDNLEYACSYKKAARDTEEETETVSKKVENFSHLIQKGWAISEKVQEVVFVK